MSEVLAAACSSAGSVIAKSSANAPAAHATLMSEVLAAANAPTDPSTDAATRTLITKSMGESHIVDRQRTPISRCDWPVVCRRRPWIVLRITSLCKMLGSVRTNALARVYKSTFKFRDFTKIRCFNQDRVSIEVTKSDDEIVYHPSCFLSIG
jgi:hypothetical protein